MSLKSIFYPATGFLPVLVSIVAATHAESTVGIRNPSAKDVFYPGPAAIPAGFASFRSRTESIVSSASAATKTLRKRVVIMEAWPHQDAVDNENNAEKSHADGESRRSFLHSIGLSMAGMVSSGPLASVLRALDTDGAATSTAANAMGLVQFPCPEGKLLNTYHMMRAGESGMEEQDVLWTNPLFLTNHEDALTELGRVQVEEACNDMMAKGINPSVVKYSLAAKSIETSNIVATTMMIGRNRVVPEFTFMDQRGAGIWDGKPMHSTEAAIWAMDAAEAGKEGRGGQPPPNDDGTANESLFDEVIRLRQLLSIMETQYSGDNILLVFPDGTSPALLSCLIAGIPLNRVHELNYGAGELRTNVDMKQTKDLLAYRSTKSENYDNILKEGNEQLGVLRKEVVDLEAANKVASQNLVTHAPAGSTPIKRSVPENLVAPRDFDSDVLSVGSAGSIGTIGYMAMRRDNEEEENDANKVSKPEEQLVPALAYATNSSPEAVATIARPVASVAQPVFAAPSAVLSADFDAFETFDPNIFEDVPVQSREERVDAANRAMDDYMNSDDGGGAWMNAMRDLVDEE